jgi:hypothetical protein
MRLTISATDRPGALELPAVGSVYPIGADAKGTIPGKVIATQPMSDRTGRIELEVAAEDRPRVIEYQNRYAARAPRVC